MKNARPESNSALLFAFAGLLLVVFPWHLFAADDAATHPAPPIVGAIRWDAWYGESGPVKWTEISLGVPKYHFRLPWFARILDEGKVRINGDSQEIIEKEIAYASEAGLNYWAFVDYWDDPTLSIALRRYRDAKVKRGIRYCFVEEGSRLDKKVATLGWTKLVEHFKDSNYLTVLDGRPLLFLFAKTQELGKKEWDGLSGACVAAGSKRPYVVLMGWKPEQDWKDAQALGFDAVSAYAGAARYNANPQSYAKLCVEVRQGLWEKCSALHIQCITLASAGWDTRPRMERPPPWIKWVKAAPDPTPPSQQKPLIDAVTATPEEIAAHLREAIAWTQRNRDINPSNTVIIYGWNENDEGGWLIPTLGADGQPNEERIKAIGKVLRSTVDAVPGAPKP